MVHILMKILVPVVTVFIAITGVLQGVDYIKNKLKKIDQPEQNEYDEFI